MVQKIGLFDGTSVIEMGKVVVGNVVTRLRGECKEVVIGEAGGKSVGDYWVCNSRGRVKICERTRRVLESTVELIAS
jgi:hypothetical protein